MAPAIRTVSDPTLVAISAGESSLSDTPLQGRNVTALSDGTEQRDVLREGTWVGIDLLGISRTTFSALSGALPAVAGALSATAAFTGAVGGILITADGVRFISEDLDALSQVKEIDKEGLLVQRLNLLQHIFYTSIGVTIYGGSSTLLFTDTVARTLGYAHQLSGTAMHVCEKVSAVFGQALAAAAIARGVVLVGTSAYKLHYLDAFQTEFRTQLNHDARWGMLLAAYNENRDAFARRVGKKAFENFNQHVQKGTRPTDPQFFFTEIDKGIHTAKCQEKLKLLIGILLIIGGFITICNPAGLSVLGLFVAGLTLFALCEALWFLFDLSGVFSHVVEWTYTPPPPDLEPDSSPPGAQATR